MDIERVTGRLSTFRGTGGGRCPGHLADELGTEPAAVRAATRRLADERHIVLDDAGEG